MVICPACGKVVPPEQDNYQALWNHGLGCGLSEMYMTGAYGIATKQAIGQGRWHVSTNYNRCWCGEEFNSLFSADNSLMSHWLSLDAKQLEEHRALWLLRL